MFFDLSAAYDVLDRDIFLRKAEVCGIAGSALKWLRSYLSNRSQIVQVGQGYSGQLILDSGTPQGSACSCLVFIMYVGDLPLWINEGFLEAYADDVFVTVEADTETELRKKLEKEGENILKFFASNRLVANASKTALIVFRTKNQGELFSIELQGEIITEADEEKLLGVHVQGDLKWTKHIDKVTSDLNYGLSVLQRLRHHLGKKELTIVADGLVMAKVRYCLPAFAAEAIRLQTSDPQSTQLQRIQVCQNNMLRTLTGSHRRDRVRVADMLASTGFLSVNQWASYSLLMEIWKA